MTIRSVFILFAGATVLLTAQTATAGDFELPESAIFDAAHHRIIVSNIKGGFRDADRNGYLSSLNPDGTVMAQHWLTGLDAPKGMAILGDRLFVADVAGLVEVDLESAAVVAVHHAKTAEFLNDVTASDDAVYVSDLMTDTIWRLQDGNFEPWVQSAALSHPNGIAWDEDRLIVGSWGQGLHEDFTTDAPGDLLAVDAASQDIEVIAEGVGNIDGVVMVGGRLIVSDWVQGALIEVQDGGAEVIGTFPAGLADIGTDGVNLLLPHMLEGRVQVLPLP
jgi:sugar lactone lactonase YvrE